jgi:hypothetical protein
VRPADLSTQALHDLQDAARRAPLGNHVVLLDTPSERTTLDSAFEGLIADAGRLVGLPAVEVVVDGSIAADATDVFRLTGGRLIRVPR